MCSNAYKYDRFSVANEKTLEGQNCIYKIEKN